MTAARTQSTTKTAPSTGTLYAALGAAEAVVAGLLLWGQSSQTACAYSQALYGLLLVPAALAAALLGLGGAAILTGAAMVVGIVLGEMQASYGCEAAQAAAIPPWALRVCAMGALGLVTGWVAQRQLGRMRDLERGAAAREKDVQRLQREADAQARLVESLQARAAEKEDIRRHYQTITHWFDDLVRMLGQDLREESALTSLLRVLERELGASAGVIYLWREEERALDPAAHFGFVEAPKPVPAGDPLLVEFLAHPDWKVLRDSVKPEDVRMRDLLERTQLLANPAIPLFSTWESAGGAPRFLGLLDFAGIAPALKQESHVFMRLVATMAGQGIERTREHERKALRDGLTDLWNRRAVYEKLARCFADAQAGRAPLSVVMSDIDKFKAFNDSYGHAAGDFVLREFAALAKAGVAPKAMKAACGSAGAGGKGGVVGRYGGEEFIFLFPGLATAEAVKVVEAIRARLEAQRFDFEGSAFRVTSSFGVAEAADGPKTLEMLVQYADAALYRAKECGRNRVCAHADDEAREAA